MKKLNKKQKQFLFDNYYVTSKVLDALTYKGWEDYFIKNFDWKLDLEYDPYGFNKLYLADKKTGDYDYIIGLNFQGNDKQLLLEVK